MDECSKFDLFFASIAGWILHPGYQREGTPRPTLEACADIAETMVLMSEARAAVVKEEEDALWRGPINQERDPCKSSA